MWSIEFFFSNQHTGESEKKKKKPGLRGETKYAIL